MFAGCEIVSIKKIARGEDENLAHDVGLLLIAAHEADHLSAGRVLDHGGEASTHEAPEYHAPFDHGRGASTFKQRLLDAGESAAQHADDEIIRVVRLCAGGLAAVELFEQSYEPVGDCRQDLAVAAGA